MIREAFIIPDSSNIEESLRISRQFNTGFEYNDFFMPDLLDDEKRLSDRIQLYKSLDRDRSRDRLHGVFFDICLNSADSKIRSISQKRMESSIDIAKQLSCRGVIFHTNIIPGFETKPYLDGWVELNAQYYKKICKENPDLDIYVENMFDYKPDMLKRLAKELSDVANFGVCYDVAHGHVHDVPMEKWIEELKPYIRHLHINDNDGKADLHMTVGEGTVNWKDYFNLIEDLAPDVGILIEVNGAKKQEDSIRYLIENGYLN